MYHIHWFWPRSMLVQKGSELSGNSLQFPYLGWITRIVGWPVKLQVCFFYKKTYVNMLAKVLNRALGRRFIIFHTRTKANNDCSLEIRQDICGHSGDFVAWCWKKLSVTQLCCGIIVIHPKNHRKIKEHQITLKSWDIDRFLFVLGLDNLRYCDVNIHLGSPALLGNVPAILDSCSWSYSWPS